jgi:long-chain acyl-CoA synthetase
MFEQSAKEKMDDTRLLFLGIVSGERRRGHLEVAERAARMAGGFERLGVRQGDSVCILMRNDIAFIESAYAAMQLGAYAVPINWHFKPEEIHYILEDSGTRVLIGHADLLHGMSEAIPKGVTVFSVPTPPEFWLTTKSIPITSRRLASRSIWSPGLDSRDPMMDRCDRSRKT